MATDLADTYTSAQDLLLDLASALAEALLRGADVRCSMGCKTTGALMQELLTLLVKELSTTVASQRRGFLRVAQVACRSEDGKNQTRDLLKESGTWDFDIKRLETDLKKLTWWACCHSLEMSTYVLRAYFLADPSKWRHHLHVLVPGKRGQAHLEAVLQVEPGSVKEASTGQDGWQARTLHLLNHETKSTEATVCVSVHEPQQSEGWLLALWRKVNSTLFDRTLNSNQESSAESHNSQGNTICPLPSGTENLKRLHMNGLHPNGTPALNGVHDSDGQVVGDPPQRPMNGLPMNGLPHPSSHESPRAAGDPARCELQGVWSDVVDQMERDRKRFLGVSAEKGTSGKASRLTFARKGRPSNEDSERVVQPAEQPQEDPEEMKRKMEAKDALWTYVRYLQNSLCKEDLDPADKKHLDEKVGEVTKLLKQTPLAERQRYEEMHGELEMVANAIELKLVIGGV